MIEAMLMSDEMLANMENFLRQAGEKITASSMAKLLANQQLSFCRAFIYSGIIDFYAKLREQGWVESKIVLSGARKYEFIASDESVTNKLFFTKGSPENALRKLYNIFIEHGFYQRYGSHFGKELAAADDRFVNWSTKDSKIQEPLPETWQQYLQRTFSGQAQITEERYTYSHPISSTRPT